MPGETFVDVTYRGLELGRRHKLCEVGPTTAYLEHPTPMPVGSRLELLADGGVQVAVEVVRVHEQVAGAERAPGMRVKAPSLDERAASLWRSLVSVDDPAPPPRSPRPARPSRPPRTTAQSAAPPAPAALPAAAAPPEPRDAGEPAARAARTEVMDAVDIEAIIATATPDQPGETSAEDPVDTGNGDGKKRRGGRKRNRK